MLCKMKQAVIILAQRSCATRTGPRKKAHRFFDWPNEFSINTRVLLWRKLKSDSAERGAALLNFGIFHKVSDFGEGTTLTRVAWEATCATDRPSLPKFSDREADRLQNTAKETTAAKCNYRVMTQGSERICIGTCTDNRIWPWRWGCDSPSYWRMSVRLH